MSRYDDDPDPPHHYGDAAYGDEYDGEYDQYGQYGQYDEAYETESPSVARARRRRRRALLTLLVVVLGLFFAFWWAYSYFKDSDGSTSKGGSTTATCRPATSTPSGVTLNVYNTTTRAGLAASAAEEFRAQGYQVAAVANDPLKRQVAGPAEIRFGPAGAAAAEQFVFKSIGTGVTSENDGRTDASIDVALGQGFVKLSPLPTPDRDLPVCPTPEPSSVAPSPASPSPATS